MLRSDVIILHPVFSHTGNHNTQLSLVSKKNPRFHGWGNWVWSTTPKTKVLKDKDRINEMAKLEKMERNEQDFWILKDFETFQLQTSK